MSFGGMQGRAMGEFPIPKQRSQKKKNELHSAGDVSEGAVSRTLPAEVQEPALRGIGWDAVNRLE